MSNISLWGDLSSLETIRTPKSILEEQAKILTDATKGSLVGEVDAREVHESFSYDLNIVVPTLNNYKYTLLTIQHEVHLYPVDVISNVLSRVGQRCDRCDNESDFEAALENILSSSMTKTILSRLLSQAR